LAKKANIKYSTLTKIRCSAVTKPSVQTIVRIAKSLGEPMEEFNLPDAADAGQRLAGLTGT
jgi:transcriptional regulator with XRE-family HTH domain